MLAPPAGTRGAFRQVARVRSGRVGSRSGRRVAPRSAAAAHPAATPAGPGRAPGRPGTAAGCRGARGRAVTWSPSPHSTISPCNMTATRWRQVPDDGEVVGDEQVGDPGAFLDLLEQVQHPAWVDRSSADTGSSQTISFGSRASARAIAMRCRWPPENSRGNRSAAPAGRPHLLQQVPDPLRRVLHRDIPHRQRFGEDRLDRHRRVQRGVRVLEHHLDLRRQRRGVPSGTAARCPGPGRAPARR